uniref:Uncharacterized protein n=1 Tax=Oryza punctata TaxID=4537 RepID=A0A0E0L259_ORYPU
MAFSRMAGGHELADSLAFVLFSSPGTDHWHSIVVDLPPWLQPPVNGLAGCGPSPASNLEERGEVEMWKRGNGWGELGLEAHQEHAASNHS